MSSQANKKTRTTIDEAKFLGQSTRTQMPLVSPELTETFSVIEPRADQDGNVQTIDWTLVQSGIAALLDQASRVLHEASQAFRMSRVKLIELNRLRKEVTQTLTKRHAATKKLIQGSYAPAALPLLGLEVPVSRAYSAIRERIVDAVRRMRNPDLVSKIGDPLEGSLPLDFDGLAQGLEDAIVAYDDLENELIEAKKIRDEAKVAESDAFKRHRRIYVNLARAQEGFYRLVGLDELADRIRVTIPVRKPATQEPDSGTPAQEPTEGESPTDPVPTDPAPTDPAPTDPAP